MEAAEKGGEKRISIHSDSVRRELENEKFDRDKNFLRSFKVKDGLTFIIIVVCFSMCSN